MAALRRCSKCHQTITPRAIDNQQLINELIEAPENRFRLTGAVRERAPELIQWLQAPGPNAEERVLILEMIHAAERDRRPLIKLSNDLLTQLNKLQEETKANTEPIARLNQARLRLDAANLRNVELQSQLEAQRQENLRIRAEIQEEIDELNEFKTKAIPHLQAIDIDGEVLYTSNFGRKYEADSNRLLTERECRHLRLEGESTHVVCPATLAEPFKASHNNNWKNLLYESVGHSFYIKAQLALMNDYYQKTGRSLPCPDAHQYDEALWNNPKCSSFLYNWCADNFESYIQLNDKQQDESEEGITEDTDEIMRPEYQNEEEVNTIEIFAGTSPPRTATIEPSQPRFGVLITENSGKSLDAEKDEVTRSLFGAPLWIDDSKFSSNVDKHVPKPIIELNRPSFGTLGASNNKTPFDEETETIIDNGKQSNIESPHTIPFRPFAGIFNGDNSASSIISPPRVVVDQRPLSKLKTKRRETTVQANDPNDNNGEAAPNVEIDEVHKQAILTLAGKTACCHICQTKTSRTSHLIRHYLVVHKLGKEILSSKDKKCKAKTLISFFGINKD